MEKNENNSFIEILEEALKDYSYKSNPFWTDKGVSNKERWGKDYKKLEGLVEKMSNEYNNKGVKKMFIKLKNYTINSDEIVWYEVDEKQVYGFNEAGDCAEEMNYCITINFKNKNELDIYYKDKEELKKDYDLLERYSF